jgi:tryptophanase
VYPELEMVRLAIPRRVYTQSHLDYVVEIFSTIKSKLETIRGYKITYEPELLRHFSAQFEPL